MGKHLLFFIHGIGIHEPSWGEELNGPIETLKKVSQQYAYFQQAGQDRFANVECISVHYDEVFCDTIANGKATQARLPPSTLPVFLRMDWDGWQQLPTRIFGGAIWRTWPCTDVFRFIAKPSASR